MKTRAIRPKRVSISSRSNRTDTGSIQISRYPQFLTFFSYFVFIVSTESDKKSTRSLCYCIPEFHNLTMDTLPDASSLIEQLKASIDNTTIGPSLLDAGAGGQPKSHHSLQLTPTIESKVPKITLQRTESTTHNNEHGGELSAP